MIAITGNFSAMTTFTGGITSHINHMISRRITGSIGMHIFFMTVPAFFTLQIMYVWFVASQTSLKINTDARSVTGHAIISLVWCATEFVAINKTAGNCMGATDMALTTGRMTVGTIVIETVG